MHSRRMKQIFLLLPLALTACATLTAESEQTISVVTEPAGASCVLTNSEGSYAIKQTPGSAEVTRAFSPLTITCAKPGAGSGSAVLEATTRGRAYGNILMAGVPALVDAHTGKGYEYEPANVVIPLR